MSEPLRTRLARGDTVIGSWINSASPVVAELMAACGFDFLTVDAEHSAVDLPQVMALFQAIRSGNPECAAFVRMPGHDYATTKRYMDAGAAGVIAPLINSADEAYEVVRGVKYPEATGRPAGGRRGVGFCRDNMYGLRLTETVERSNAETVVGVQIEHIDAVDNIEAILDVPGVDIAFIGPYDLTASMGITAQFGAAEYLAAKQKVLDACRRHGVTAGLHVVQPDTGAALKARKEGYRFIAYSLDITMISHVCTEALRTLRTENRGSVP